MSSPSSNRKLPEQVVRPLCEPFRRQADCLLDLYAMTTDPAHPGQCVRCFYELLTRAKGEHSPALQPLRDWIQTHVEIAVKAGGHPATRLPVQLEDTDLESFCQRAMERVREDTAIGEPEVILELRYKDEALAV